MKRSILLALVASIALLGCSAQSHRNAIHDNPDKITVGTVQKEIKVGMSGSDVVSVLGSPNMVTSDSKHRETWVYDKVSTEEVYSSSKGGLGIILAGFISESGASSTSQRTLTIIIKFDENGLVRDYSYRQSSF